VKCALYGILAPFGGKIGAGIRPPGQDASREQRALGYGWPTCAQDDQPRHVHSSAISLPFTVHTDTLARDPAGFQAPAAPSKVSIRRQGPAASAVSEVRPAGWVHLFMSTAWSAHGSLGMDDSGPRGWAFARVARRLRIDPTAGPRWRRSAVSRRLAGPRGGAAWLH
jgi:hypothetical protein